MALSGTCILEVRNGGSDTLNGGLFNPGATLNTNGAATSATGNSPVFTSATYNFVAGDVNAYLFIKSGTNWIPGWYKIVSVAANAATLDASVGAVILYSATGGAIGVNTTAGVATTASPTSGTWSVDYSQQDAVQYSLTGLTTAAANAIILTASASVNMIGNGLVITGGTNFTTGYYQINSVVAGVSITVDRTCTSAAGAAGTAGIGGALASPGMTGAMAVGSNVAFVKYHATAYTATSASTNVAAGCFSSAITALVMCGYDTSRFVFNMNANRPTWKIGAAVSTATLFGGTGTANIVANMIFDGNSQTTSIGISLTARSVYWNVKFTSFTAGAISSTGTGAVAIGCEVTACTTVAAVTVSHALFCYIHDNSIGALAFAASATVSRCLICNNSGASSDGIAVSGSAIISINSCSIYGNGRDGIRFTATNSAADIINCILENNAGWGINGTTATLPMIVVNSASYNNTSGRMVTAAGSQVSDVGAIAGSGSFFTNAAGGDFTLNNTAGAGALCRSAGFPSTFPGLSQVSYADVGAYQHQDTQPVGQVVKVASIGTY